MRGRANGAFAIPVLVRGQRCNGALIPDTAEEMSLCASLTLTGGTDVTLCKTEAPWSFASSSPPPFPKVR